MSERRYWNFSPPKQPEFEALPPLVSPHGYIQRSVPLRDLVTRLTMPGTLEYWVDHPRGSTQLMGSIHGQRLGISIAIGFFLEDYLAKPIPCDIITQDVFNYKVRKDNWERK